MRQPGRLCSPLHLSWESDSRLQNCQVLQSELGFSAFIQAHNFSKTESWLFNCFIFEKLMAPLKGSKIGAGSLKAELAK